MELDECYKQISDERRAIILDRYERFQRQLDEDTDVVKVFDPLPHHLLDELQLIEEVSKNLQKKKEEDLSKAAQAAQQAAQQAEAEADAKKKAEEEAAQANEAEKEDA